MPAAEFTQNSIPTGGLKSANSSAWPGSNKPPLKAGLNSANQHVQFGAT